MKKILLSIVLFYIGTLIAFAQSFSLSYMGTNYNNGDTLTLISTDVNASFVSYMWIKNNSSSDIEVRVKKIILDTVPGTENYFCWTSCYLPFVYVGDTLVVRAGETNQDKFSGEYDSFGHAGKTRIMYVFYDDTNPSDSVAFVAEYYAGSGVGFSTVEKMKATATVYPNPARNSMTIDYEVPSSVNSVKFEIRNILGSVVKTIDLQSVAGKQKIDVTNLQDGIYFYSIIADNKSVFTKKLIIKN